MLALVALIYVLTLGFTLRAVGEYQIKTWTREAREARPAEARTGDEAPAQNAAISMRTIALVSAVVIFLAAAIAEAVLPRESRTLVGIIAIAVGLAVWNFLQNKRKQQVLRQAGLDALSAAASKPDDKPST